MMFLSFVSVRFLKSVLVLLVALEFFFVSVDSLKYFDSFPDSAGLIVLFFVYDAMYALNYVIPISLLLGFVVFYISLVRSNQYVALLSIGYSKRRIFMPPFLISIFIILLYIVLNTTSFVYAQESAENIINQGNVNNATGDLFVKHDSSYVYFERIYPLLQKAENVKVYDVIKLDSRVLWRVTQSREGFFIDNEWVLKDATVSTLPDHYNLGDDGIQISTFDEVRILSGFRPKVLDTIYQNKPSVSINDALTSFFILHRENSSTGRVRGILYSLIVVPFFIPFVGAMISKYSHIFSRYGSVATQGIVFSVFSLLTWGTFFSLSRLSINDLFIPEVGLILPFLVVLCFGVYCIKSMDAM